MHKKIITALRVLNPHGLLISEASMHMRTTEGQSDLAVRDKCDEGVADDDEFSGRATSGQHAAARSSRKSGGASA